MIRQTFNACLSVICSLAEGTDEIAKGYREASKAVHNGGKLIEQESSYQYKIRKANLDKEYASALAELESL